MSSSSTPSLASLGTYKSLTLSWASAGVLNVHIKVGKLNAMSQQFWADVRNCFTAIASNTDTRVVWITADGKVFTAGLDLQDHSDSFLSPKEGEDVARRALRLKPHIQAYQESFSAIENIPQPVVVSIHGACIGGGVDLITAADIRLASQEAYFSVKEVDIGLAADVGTLQRLPKVVGNHSLVREWCYTGRKISAQEALTVGLLSRVLPNREALSKESLAICVEIASKSPLAVTGTKKNLLYSRDHSVREGLEFIAQWNASALQSSDLLVSMQATLTKQPAIYSNL